MKRYKPVAVFLVAFLVYAFSIGDRLFAQSGTPHYIYLADAFLHGRLDLMTLPSNTYDLIQFQDKWYVPGLIAPALVMMPLVFFMGVSTSDIFFSVLLGAFNVSLFYIFLTEILSEKRKGDAPWLTLLFGFGTVYWWISILGDASFVAQTLSVTFMLFFTREVLIKKKSWRAGIWLGLAALSRPTTLFGILFYVIYIWLEEENWESRFRVFFSFLVPFSVFIGIILAYNAFRFGALTNFGYDYVQGHPILTSIYHQYGGFNILYMPCNIYISLFGLPIFNSGMLSLNTSICRHLAPALTPFSASQMFFFNPLGMSAFFTTPAFILLFRKKKRNSLTRAAFWGIVAIIIPLWMYHNTGFLQFGYRYILDIIVFIFILLASNKREIFFVEKILIVLSVFINFLGMTIMYAATFHLSWFYMWQTLLEKTF